MRSFRFDREGPSHAVGFEIGLSVSVRARFVGEDHETVPLGAGLVGRKQNGQGIGHGLWLSSGVRWYQGRDRCALAVVVPCFVVSSLRWYRIEIGFASVCVGYVVFCGIGLRSGLLRCALASGLFCAVVLAVVVPCFVVLWVFFFFFLLWTGGGGGGGCGCGCSCGCDCDGKVVVIGAVNVFQVVKYIILL